MDHLLIPIVGSLIAISFLIGGAVMQLTGDTFRLSHFARLFVVADTFVDLIAKESNPLVFYSLTAWGKYLYFTSVRGQAIYTVSKKRLVLPDRCELIQGGR